MAEFIGMDETIGETYIFIPFEHDVDNLDYDYKTWYLSGTYEWKCRAEVTGIFSGSGCINIRCFLSCFGTTLR